MMLSLLYAQMSFSTDLDDPDFQPDLYGIE